MSGTLLFASKAAVLINDMFPLLGMRSEEFNVAMITTASEINAAMSYSQNNRQFMREQGYRYEEIDIVGKSERTLRRFFAGCNVINMVGGDTFYLLKALKETGCDGIIRELVAQGVAYTGASAGTYVACPTIQMATWKSTPVETHGLTDLGALHLLDAMVKCHYTDTLAEMLNSHSATCEYPIIPLRDSEGLIVRGEQWSVFAALA